MSYQVLARKWRPQKFSELVGQEHVVNAISNALDNNRLHHAYLFTGTRGVGKTTIARIFAKSLNCETGQGANPCGKCDTCVDIEQGRFVDLLEIDAASRTKVEDTRELLDNVQYRPTRGDYKVYLIDEVHMLSKHSFNALLKTLEEPPPHVKFLLATTDPQKLPITILSRCLQFNLKALSREQIAKQLAYVLEQESIQNDESALSLIARAAQGSMRDALSLTDQAIAQGDNTVLKDTVTNMLGLLDKNHIYKILQSLVSNDNQKVLSLVEDIADQAPDFSQVLQELNATLHQIALTQIVPEACKLETTHARVIYQLAKTFSAEQVQLLYQIGLDGVKTLPFAPDPRTGVEMILMRMLAFTPRQLVDNPEAIIQQMPAATKSSSSDDNAKVQVENHIPAQPAPESNVVLESSTENHPEVSAPEMEHTDIDHINSLMEEQREVEHQASQMRSHHPQEMQRGMAELTDVPLADASNETTVANDNDELARTKAMLALQQRMQQAASEASDDGKKPEVGQQEAERTEQLITPISNPPLETPPWEVSEPVSESNAELNATPSSEKQPEVHEEGHQESTETVSHLSDETAVSVDNTATLEQVQNERLKPFLDSGEKLIHASQIDAWSSLVESLDVGGLIKQTALHSTYDKQADAVTLTLHNTQKHLLNDSVQGQLQTALTKALQQTIQLAIKAGEPKNTPFELQQRIQNMRLAHATDIANTDTSVQQLINSFNASVIPDSIKPK